MTYRLAKRSDFATGLASQHSLFDYWGNVVLPLHAPVETHGHEALLLSRDLWIWDGAAPPDAPPKDTQSPASPKAWLDLEIDSLKILAKGRDPLPANFLTVIWRHSRAIELFNQTCAWHPLAFLCFGSHPSNSVRNAYACAILAGRVAAGIGLAVDERRAVVCAALTMNWSIFATQDKLSSAKGNPTAADMQQIKDHPKASSRFLEGRGLLNQHWLLSVAQHHEEPDGKGYPARLAAPETYVGAQILRACDRFVAMASSRRFRAGMLAGGAIRRLDGIVPDAHGILTALRSDLGDKPPGGIWLDPGAGRFYLSLGLGSDGRTAALPLGADGPGAPVPLSDALVEVPHPEWDAAQYRMAVGRLEALGPQRDHPP